MIDTLVVSGNSSGISNASPAFLDTQPGPDHDWKITLEGKVIAITGANRGIGLALAQVC
jgi:NADP-dependent 3-hydroxy acid dehydrogenase YdfG